jgi:hypothetical protein
MDTVDLRTPTLSAGADFDAPSGAAAAFAILATMACSVGLLAGALLF